MKSLDPRVNRLPETENDLFQNAPLDQFETFEVFVQPKDGKPFQHEGSIHAPNIEMAYVLAKETLTRRFTCTALSVVNTQHIFVSALTENNQNVYDTISKIEVTDSGKIDFDVYHLMKRGKQHIYAGHLKASTPEEALYKAKDMFNKETTVYNVWIIATHHMRITTPEEQELWLTLPDKKFRDAADYKGGDKLKDFLEKGSR